MEIGKILAGSMPLAGMAPSFEEETPAARIQRKVDALNASIGDLDKQDGWNCDICHNKGYVAYVGEPDAYGYPSEYCKPCKCCKTRNALKRLNRAGLHNVVKECTFDLYQTPEAWQSHIKQRAMAFCNDNKHEWFFIGGQSGAGKSHICTAIAVHYIRQGKDVRYLKWMDEIKQIKSLTNDPQYGVFMKELKEAPVLYIDDLFKVANGEGMQDRQTAPQPTPADITIAFEIIDYRYNNPGMVTIISSEKTLHELIALDEAFGGRIAERAKDAGYCISLKKDSSRNWRLRGLEEI